MTSRDQEDDIPRGYESFIWQAMELSEHPFFKEIDPTHCGELLNKTEVESYPPETLIFDEGSKSDGIYLILDGTVAFTKRVPDEEARSISYSKAGLSFGEVGVFTGQPRALRVESQSNVTLAKIPSDALIRFIKTTPGSIDSILKSIVNHLHETTRHYVEDIMKQEKMAMVGTMVNTIIHDFKNPFCLISLGAQILIQLHEDEQSQKLCNNIEDQVQRMVAMAQELSEFSQGEHKLRISNVNMKALLERFQELNFPFFESERITIEVDVPEFIIEAEEMKLLRVLQNLVGNAIDAFEDRPGTIRITAEKEDEDTVAMKVTDNGNGIPEQIQEHFFEAFVTFGKSKGTGLGSAIVKSIIQAHGGSVTFETEAGKGTTFFVHLPFKQSGRTEAVAV